eukprot:jgi/Ulvmu1/4535/UM002_0261.1
MERLSRPKKVSKAAAALASLQAVKAGEKKVLDVVGLEDDIGDSQDESEDDHEDASETEEEARHKGSAPGKSHADRAADAKKRAAALDRMNAMWANATAKKRQIEASQDDDMLEQMLSELDGAQIVSQPKRPKIRYGHRSTFKKM